MQTYNTTIRDKIREFNRCFEIRLRKLRQQHLEKRDMDVLNRLKPFRRCENSDFYNGVRYVQGIPIKDEKNFCKTY